VTATAVAYSRILLKLSGEALAGDKGGVFDLERASQPVLR
jgi:uridylate kinase